MTTPLRQPAIYIPHGGGPWPFVQTPFIPPAEMASLERYLRTLITDLPAQPTAVLVVSAHWEEPVATLMTHPQPPMLFDYYGFPPETYELSWPAPCATSLIDRVTALLAQAGLPSATNAERGYDHGTFVPLMLALPKADLPILQMSLLASLDPAAHLALGRALAPLRDEGVLLIGSGYSYHNMRGFGSAESAAPSQLFDDWLAETALATPTERERRLVDWARAPAARLCHPREEHLLPLHVMAGAGHADAGTVPLRMFAMGAHASAVRFG